MEPELIVTTYWTCDCSATNPLRFRTCHNCGREMPDAFKQQIFSEELEVQKRYVKRKKYWKIQAKSNSTGEVLRQLEPVANLLLIFALVASFAVLYFAGSANLEDNTFFYMADRTDRFEQQMETAGTHFEHVKILGGGVQKSYHWVLTGENEFTYEKQKTVKSEKIEYIVDKFKGVWNHVSGKN